MKVKAINLIYWILACLPLIVTIVVFPYFPDTIPAHYNASGLVDRYGSKFELFILPAVIIVIAVFFMFFFSYVEKKSSRKIQI
jgi:uncharacterized membrane protein